MPVTVKYANAYLTDRLYGGPEEGGWYYDCGEPIMSLPFLVDEEGERTTENGTEFHYDNLSRNMAYERLYDLCEAAGHQPPERVFFARRDWSIDGMAFYIESKPGEYFRQERPHYE